MARWALPVPMGSNFVHSAHVSILWSNQALHTCNLAVHINDRHGGGRVE